MKSDSLEALLIAADLTDKEIFQVIRNMGQYDPKWTSCSLDDLEFWVFNGDLWLYNVINRLAWNIDIIGELQKIIAEKG